LSFLKGLWLGTETEDYKGKQAHVELASRMRKRDPALQFNDGERISYVFVKCGGGNRAFEKAEDPCFVMKHGLVVDYRYYVEHQVSDDIGAHLPLIVDTAFLTIGPEPDFKNSGTIHDTCRHH
jgi:DNA polymerase elongation subunit (family B)